MSQKHSNESCKASEKIILFFIFRFLLFSFAMSNYLGSVGAPSGGVSAERSGLSGTERSWG